MKHIEGPVQPKKSLVIAEKLGNIARPAIKIGWVVWVTLMLLFR
jgi:hypothetical protein